jgi:RNA polymerase sigma-70 factor (ECF subfamily)
MSEFKEQELSDWANSQGWNDFFTQFNEYLRSLAYSYKLPSQDVDDVVQEVFVSMANYFKENKFDSAKGKIHSWVTTFAKWRMVDIIRRNQRKNKRITSGDDLLMEMQPDEKQDFDASQEKSYQRELLMQAFENLGRDHKSKDYMIFNDLYFNDLKNENLMLKYKINSSAIYIAKHRIIKKIKEEINHILCSQPNY